MTNPPQWLRDLKEGRNTDRWRAMQVLRGTRITQHATKEGAPMPQANNPRVGWPRRVKALHVMAALLAKEVEALHSDMLDWMDGDHTRINADRERESGPAERAVGDGPQAQAPQAEGPDSPQGRW